MLKTLEKDYYWFKANYAPEHFMKEFNHYKMVEYGLYDHPSFVLARTTTIGLQTVFALVANDKVIKIGNTTTLHSYMFDFLTKWDNQHLIYNRNNIPNLIIIKKDIADKKEASLLKKETIENSHSIIRRNKIKNILKIVG